MKTFLALFFCIVFCGFYFAGFCDARGVRKVVPFNIGSTEKGEETKEGLENKIRSYKNYLDAAAAEFKKAYEDIPANVSKKKFSGNRDGYLYFDKYHYNMKQKNNKTDEEKKLEKDYYTLKNYYHISSEIDRMEKKLSKYK